MSKFESLFRQIFKTTAEERVLLRQDFANKFSGGSSGSTKSPKKKPKYGEGKHKQAVLVRTPSGKVVTEQRSVGVKAKEKKQKPVQQSLMPENQSDTSTDEAIKSYEKNTLPSPKKNSPKEKKPKGSKKAEPVKPISSIGKQGLKSSKQRQEAEARQGMFDEEGDIARAMVQEPKPSSNSKIKPKKGGKSKKAEPVKSVGSIGKQGLKSSKQRQEAEARQGMFDEEGDLARAMVQEPKPIQSIAEKEKEILAEKPKKEKKKPNTEGLQKFNTNKKDSKQLSDAREGMFDEEGDLARAMTGERKESPKASSKNEPMDSVFPDEMDDDMVSAHSHNKLGNLHSVLSNAGINSVHKNGSLDFMGSGGKKFKVKVKDTGSEVPRANGQVHRHIQYEVSDGKDSTGVYDHLHDLVENHFGKKLGGAMIDSAHDSSPELSKTLSKEYRDTKAHLKINPSVASNNKTQHVKDPKTSYFKLGGHEGVKRTKAEMNELQKHAIDNGARYTGHGDVWSVNQNQPQHDSLIEKHGGALKRGYVKSDTAKIETKPNSVGKLESKVSEKKKTLSVADKKDNKQLADARQGMFDEEGDLARAMSGSASPTKPQKSPKEKKAEREKEVAGKKKVFADNDKIIGNMKKEGAGYHSGLDQGDYASPNAPDPLAKKPSASIQKLKEATASANKALEQVGAKPKPSSFGFQSSELPSRPKNIKQATADGKKALEQVGAKPKPVQPALSTAPPPPKVSTPVKSVVEKPVPTGESGEYSGKEYKEKTYIDKSHDTVNMSEGQKNRLGVQKDEGGKHFVDFSKLDGKNHQRAVSDLDKHKQAPVKVSYGTPRK